jgi:hypothetical protein
LANAKSRKGEQMITWILAFVLVIAVGAFGIASANYQAKHKNESAA